MGTAIAFEEARPAVGEGLASVAVGVAIEVAAEVAVATVELLLLTMDGSRNATPRTSKPVTARSQPVPVRPRPSRRLFRRRYGCDRKGDGMYVLGLETRS
jgi:hypothetical protein